MTELDELREKVAQLRAGCLNMTRDELIKNITSVGPDEYKAGHWLSMRDAKRRKAFREQFAEEILSLDDPMQFHAPGWRAGIELAAKTIREGP